MAQVNKCNWANDDERKRYQREYAKRRRAEGLQASSSRNPIHHLRPKAVKVKHKRDIWEVAAIMYKALNMADEVICACHTCKAARQAVEVYEQFWGEE